MEQNIMMRQKRMKRLKKRKRYEKKLVISFMLFLFFFSSIGIISFADKAISAEPTTVLASSGAYSLTFSAADPSINNAPYIPTYKKLTPSAIQTLPVGRAKDPLPNAVFGKPKDSVQSLAPADMALGTIVPFEVQIEVNGSTAPENGVIYFTPYWLTKVTNGGDFGYDPNYKVLAAFVDYGDAASYDPGENAKVESFSSSIVSPNTKDEQIQSTIKVSGLDNGDKVIVEIWLVLKSTISKDITGVVQSGMISAKTANGDTINTGQETVPLNKVGDFYTATADVSIKKQDSPDPIYSGDTLTYTIRATNNSADTVANGIIIKDTLDQNVTFVSATDGGTLDGNIITWPAFYLDVGAYKEFIVTVTVNQNVPTSNYEGTIPDNRGTASETRLAGVDISNIVKIDSMITVDSNLANNVWQEPTNVLPRVTFTAYKVWVGGSASDHKPVNLTLYRQVGNGARQEVTNVSPIISPAAGPSNNFTYTWNGLPKYDVNSQPYIYTVDELTVPEGYTKTVDASKNTVTNTYKPILIITKVYGTTPLKDAVFALYKSPDNVLAQEELVSSITTGTDGKAAFEGLIDGTYWLLETQPPTGYYAASNAPIGPFKVSNGTITGPEGFTLSQDGTKGSYTVYNQKYGSIELLKIDSVTGTPLQYAEFDLYSEVPAGTEGSIQFSMLDGSSIYGLKINAEALVTGADGKTPTVKNLKIGSYFAVETKAPIDPIAYYPLQEPIRINLSDANLAITFTIKNIKAAVMPQTGGIGTIIFTIVGISLMGGALIALRKMSKRKEDA
ncbi:SpaA isopeptide-forming pilin-related protein [Clostridium swellfunianum]|uniref:SpaA isopeptide-forming pilin-related protein n=1 Tax=Clostridium swellfunianum TaxID=1367462 RepID=UPI00202FC074|nr:SpaA isopeptide-forming pilin-related protein [Clostridium swellfunianum]MCM0650005.1 SpaA isopeptide-forming pilin-related protein [Clostridium swellfunianum]